MGLNGYLPAPQIHISWGMSALPRKRRSPGARNHKKCWGVKDSNLRRPKPTDLQSVPFVRLGNSPIRNGTLLNRTSMTAVLDVRMRGIRHRLPIAPWTFQVLKSIWIRMGLISEAVRSCEISRPTPGRTRPVGSFQATKAPSALFAIGLAVLEAAGCHSLKNLLSNRAQASDRWCFAASSAISCRLTLPDSSTAKIRAKSLGLPTRSAIIAK